MKEIEPRGGWRTSLVPPWIRQWLFPLGSWTSNCQAILTSNLIHHIDSSFQIVLLQFSPNLFSKYVLIIISVISHRWHNGTTLANRSARILSTHSNSTTVVLSYRPMCRCRTWDPFPRAGSRPPLLPAKCTSSTTITEPRPGSIPDYVSTTLAEW